MAEVTSLDFSRLLDWLRASLPQAAAVFIASGFFVFVPDQVAERIALSELRAAYRGWASVVMIGSGALVVTTSVPKVYKTTSRIVVSRRSRRARLERLHNLSLPEKSLLRKYLEANTRTQYFEISDGVAQGLLAEGFLFKPSSVSQHYMTFAYNMQPWVWDYLEAHPDLLAEAGRDAAACAGNQTRGRRNLR